MTHQPNHCRDGRSLHEDGNDYSNPIGTIIARFKPEGMARVLIATALAQTLIAVIALVGRLGFPYSGPLEIVTINGFFVALFVGSALLFRKASRGRLDRVAA